jgi:NADH-quinone oxidoreductase subunit A
MGQYLPVVVMMVLALVFGVVSLVVSRLLAPRRSTPDKSAPYECGIVPAGRSLPERFPVHFYLVAMIFIVFDIEIIFLFPWATMYREIGGFGLVAIVLFSVPVLIGLLYEVATGTFGWGDQHTRPRGQGRLEPVATYAPQVSPAGAATSVRTVGLEGRTGEPTDGEPAREVVAS